MPPLSEKKKASNLKWDAAHLKRMSLAIPLDLFDRMQGHVSDTGEKINGFIKRAIIETIDRDNNARNKCNEALNYQTQDSAASLVDFDDPDVEDCDDETISPAVRDVMDFLDSRNDALGIKCRRD